MRELWFEAIGNIKSIVVLVYKEVSEVIRNCN